MMEMNVKFAKWLAFGAAFLQLNAALGVPMEHLAALLALLAAAWEMGGGEKDGERP